MSGQTCGMCDSEELCICGGYQQRAATVADNEAWSKAIRARTDELMQEAAKIKQPGAAMSDTGEPGAVRAFVDGKTIDGRSMDIGLPIRVVLASTARDFADRHDADDARRDAATKQARELLDRLLHWDSFHDPAGPWLDWITHWKAETEKALAAVDAVLGAQEVGT